VTYQYRKQAILWGCWLLFVLLISCTPDQATNAPTSNPILTDAEFVSATIAVTRESATAIPPTPNPTSTTIPTIPATLTPEPTPLPASLVVLSEPTGAVVTIAEVESAANTPHSMQLPAGSYTVIVSQQGYQDWEDTVLLTAGDTLELSVQLVPDPRIAGQYIALAEVGGIGAVDEIPHLAALTWELDQQAFVYAIQKNIGFTEPRDWAWWQFDLLARENLTLDPPQTLLDSETRAALNLCPLDEQEWVGPGKCRNFTRVFESDANDLIVFSPVPDDLYSENRELWVARLDGSDAQILADFAPGYAHWSRDGQWLAVGWPFAGLPGQAVHYLVARDGSYIETLQQITGIDSFYLNGLFPQFSPTKPELLIAGSEIYESREASDYNLYILDFDTLEHRFITERIGFFQWADNGQGIYVLDGASYLPSTQPASFDMRQTNLYYIDLTQSPPHEYLIAQNIPYYPHNGYGTWNWAYSPTSQAIAYVGYRDEEELGVLFLEPIEEQE
jgi:hypothetical protein